MGKLTHVVRNSVMLAVLGGGGYATLHSVPYLRVEAVDAPVVAVQAAACPRGPIPTLLPFAPADRCFVGVVELAAAGPEVGLSRVTTTLPSAVTAAEYESTSLSMRVAGGSATAQSDQETWRWALLAGSVWGALFALLGWRVWSRPAARKRRAAARRDAVKAQAQTERARAKEQAAGRAALREPDAV